MSANESNQAHTRTHSATHFNITFPNPFKKRKELNNTHLLGSPLNESQRELNDPLTSTPIHWSAFVYPSLCAEVHLFFLCMWEFVWVYGGMHDWSICIVRVHARFFITIELSEAVHWHSGRPSDKL